MPIYAEPCYPKIRRKFLAEQQNAYTVKRSHKMIACSGKYRNIWLKYTIQEKERRGGLNMSFSSPKYVQSIVPK
jgi:hypothetical protein